MDSVHNDGVVGRELGGHSEHTNDAGIAVVEGRHGVEQVGHQRGAGRDAVDGLVQVGGGVAH